MSSENVKIKFENYIYLSICEMLISTIGETKCSGLYGYCNSIKFDLNNCDLNGKPLTYIRLYIRIFEYLKLVYGLDESECSYYLYKFIDDDKYKVFEKPVMLLTKHFRYQLGNPKNSVS